MFGETRSENYFKDEAKLEKIVRKVKCSDAVITHDEKIAVLTSALHVKTLLLTDHSTHWLLGNQRTSPWLEDIFIVREKQNSNLEIIQQLKEFLE